MNATATPYKALFGCLRAVPDEDGDLECSHPGDCEYAWLCSACGRDVSADACPEHAPREVPGLRMIQCEDGCPRTWVLDDDGYEPPCPWCAIDAEAKAHAGCAHARHGRWRRWTVTRWLLRHLYALGVLGAYGTSYGGGCKGCAAVHRWGRNGYLLGWPRWKWRCLLVQRHWPGEEVLREICGKCCPQPCCGSVTSGHSDDCPETTAP